eukprot:3287860-Pleurochrysis_carterae.AAC.1
MSVPLVSACALCERLRALRARVHACSTRAPAPLARPSACPLRAMSALVMLETTRAGSNPRRWIPGLPLPHPLSLR